MVRAETGWGDGRASVESETRRFTDNCSLNVFALHTTLNAFSEFDELQAMSNLSKESPSPMLTSLLGNPPPEEREEEQELYLNDSEIGARPQAEIYSQ